MAEMTEPKAARVSTPKTWSEDILRILREHYGKVTCQRCGHTSQVDQHFAAAHQLLTVIGNAQLSAINDCLTKIVTDVKR
jgi:hypothetical protein